MQLVINKSLAEVSLADPETAISKEEHLYGLPIFWDLVQDRNNSTSEVANDELLDLSLQAIKDILEEPYGTRIRLYYLLKALKNIENGESLRPSIQIVI